MLVYFTLSIKFYICEFKFLLNYFNKSSYEQFNIFTICFKVEKLGSLFPCSYFAYACLVIPSNLDI